jgi:sugar/nucleoside kinase (ribokinase family)
VYGDEKLDPIFEPVNEICRVHSLGDPAITHVFEFDDGKILMSYMEAVQDITWARIVAQLGLDKINQLIAESDVIGVGYWSLLPAFDEIVTQISALLPQDNKNRKFFFDFADFLKKDSASLYKSLEILKALNEKAPVILSLNEHEAAALFAKYNETMDNELELPNKLENVRKNLGLNELVVHTPYYAVAASSNEKAVLVECPFCEKPVRTAGAGDTFNGGYIAAHLAKFDIKERLHVANAAVGYFLRNGKFPNIENLKI